MTYLQGESSYRRAEQDERGRRFNARRRRRRSFTVGRVIVVNDHPARLAQAGRRRRQCRHATHAAAHVHA
jgi:hypothetical protein